MLNGVLAQFRTVIGHALSQVQNTHVSHVNKSAVETLEDRSVPAVSGLVFQDYNANGVFDTLGTSGTAVDRGVANVTVTAYDANNNVVLSTTTNATGNYLLSTSPGSYRLEFTNLPIGYVSGATGAGSNSSVQFVNDGDVANYGINVPAQYSQNSPRLLTSVMFIGANNGAAASNGAIQEYSFGATGNWGTDASETSLATFSDVGAVYGIAYQNTSNTVFASSFMRRHSGFGPSDSTGVIYAINRTTNSITEIDLNGIPGFNGAGTNPHPNGSANFNRDTASFAVTSRVAFGDLELSEDGRYLYTINLNTQELIEIDLGPDPSNPNTSPTIANIRQIAIPDAVVGRHSDMHSFGLGVRNGLVYVGQVDTAQSTGLSSDLDGYVWTYDRNSGPSGTFSGSPIFSFALDYARQIDDGVRPAQWRPWDDSYAPSAGFFSFAQAIFADIAFDRDGSMIIGLRDRAGDQYGSNQLQPNVADNNLYSVVAIGDILRASFDGSSWTLESNGTAGSVTTAGANSGSGPGGGEYYFQDNYINIHPDASSGAIVQVPGFNQVVSSAMDPFNEFNTGGVRWFNNGTGTLARGYELYRQSQDPGSFGKANGTGDLEALSDSTPFEVGNRIWNDANGNGRQDAGELGIANISVLLCDAAGNPIPGASVITDSNGNYYFSSGSGTNTASKLFGVNIQAGVNYQICVDLTQANLSGFALTVSGFGGETVDSDADLATVSEAFAPFTVSLANPVDHDRDFGFVQTAALGNRVFFDNNRNGTDDGEPGVDGVTVRLFNTSNTLIATQTTAGGGLYQFNNVTPGDYYVVFDPATLPATYVFTTQGATGSSDPTDSDPDATGRTENINLSSGETDLTWDAGIVVNLASIGDRVFFDNNNNGTDDGEPGVGNVTVRLFRSDNTLVGTVVTNPANGSYNFGSLTPGDYYVVFDPATLPAGYSFTSRGPTGTSDPNDSDPDGTGRTETTTLVGGENDLTWDAGVANAIGTIGNRVFFDQNNNGTIDVGETGIDNVTINLYLDANNDNIADGAAVATQQTTGGGYYLFTSLVPNTYIVEAIRPVGYLSSSGSNARPTGAYEVAADPDNNIDSDDNGTAIGNSVRSRPITLNLTGEPTTEADLGPQIDSAPNNSSNLTVDFGFFRPMSIGNRVFHDLNNNGTRDSGDPGLAGVVMNLFEDTNNDNVADGAAIATTTTDANGYYIFNYLRPTSYIVSATASAAFLSSSGTNGSITGPFEAAVDPDNDTDNDDNGTLIGANSSARAITLTLNGEPSGDVDAGSLLDLATNVNSNQTVDFGFYRPMSLGNFVWGDDNNNGNVDAGETGINGVNVRLYTSGGTLVANTTTVNGDYQFRYLAPGDYYVELDTPAGSISSTGAFGGATGPVEPGVGGNSDINNRDHGSAISSTIIRSGTVSLVRDAEPANDGDTDVMSNLTVDFGLFRPASIAGVVWIEQNTNRIPDGTEPRIPGVTIQLTGTATDGTPISATQVTDANGAYLFSGLPAGTYTVTQVQPVGYLDGPDRLGNGGGSIGNDVQTAIPITAGEAAVNHDFGEYAPVRIAGSVFVDLNNDCLRNGADEGISGVTITLTGVDLAGNSISRTTTTNNQGGYSFENLVAGVYTIQETQPGGGFLDGGERAGTGGGTVTNDTITVALGAASINNDFCELVPARIAGRTYVDRNNNGVFDAGELPIAGVQVTLTGNDDRAAINLSTTTNANGLYEFTNLRPGTYSVSEAQPTGYGDGLERAGNKSGSIAVNDVISAIPIASGDNAIFYDFGEVSSSIAGVVYVDANNNGSREANEAPIAGVTIILSGTDGSGNPVNRQTVTAPDGSYLFDSLPAGTYTVQQVQPTAYRDGIDTIGSLGGTASNDILASIVLGVNQQSVANNFGEIGLISDLISKRDLLTSTPRFNTGTNAPQNPNTALANLLGGLLSTTPALQTTPPPAPSTPSNLLGGLLSTTPSLNTTPPPATSNPPTNLLSGLLSTTPALQTTPPPAPSTPSNLLGGLLSTTPSLNTTPPPATSNPPTNLLGGLLSTTPSLNTGSPPATSNTPTGLLGRLFSSRAR